MMSNSHSHSHSHSQIPKSWLCNKLYGASISKLRDLSLTYFSIPPHYSHCFSDYYLLYNQGSYILSHSINGTIYRDGIEYIVVYHNDLTRDYIKQNRLEQYALSFRKAQPEFELPAYVLVSRTLKQLIEIGD